MNKNQNKDNILHNRLVRLIEEKLGWGKGKNWSHSQFEDLSVLVQNETGILLSPNTLKRFFGKIESESSASKTTKNTLARFAGYKNFAEFGIEKQTGSGEKESVKLKWFKTRRIIYLVSISLVLFVILVLISVNRKWNLKIQLEKAEFSQLSEVGNVPFTQIFKYNVNHEILDTIYFQEFDKNPIALSTKDSVFSYVHFVPGFRKARFFTAERTLWETTYRVESDGWLFLFPHGSLEPRKYIPLIPKDGIIKIEESVLEENRINPEEDGGWINYFNCSDFGVNGDNFRFETRIRNELKTGSQQCQDAIIKIECEEFFIECHFTQQGCQKYASLKLGNDFYDGIKNDLSCLTLDLNQWQNLTISSEADSLKIFNEQKLLIAKPINGSPGKIVGLHYSFRGNGEVSRVEFN